MRIDAYDKLILHASAFPFVDKSPVGRAVTNTNGVTLSATESKFSGASAKFVAASSQQLDIAYNGDFDFDAGDFCIDTWVWATDVVGTENIISARTGANFTGFMIHRDGALWKWSASAGGASFDYSNGKQFGTATAEQWDHLAVCRDGANVRIFLNGVSGQGTNDLAGLITPSTLTIGADADGGESFDGYLQETRISKGVPRWTANFTPPTSPYWRPLHSTTRINPVALRNFESRRRR